MIYPAVKCVDKELRVKLVTELFRLGFRRHGSDNLTAIQNEIRGNPYEYIVVGNNLGHNIIVTKKEAVASSAYHWKIETTIVNSPAHMLSYIEKMGIKAPTHG